MHIGLDAAMRISDREFNRLRTLRALRRAEPISRTDLAALAGLDGGTITEISGTLLGRNLIQEEKVPTGKRGRPQRHLRLNPEGAFAVGAYIGINGEIVCEIVNLRGDRLYLSSTAMGIVTSLEEFATVIATRIDAAITASGIVASSLSCAGVALPAVVDSSRGIVHWVQTFDTAPYPAALLMERKLGIPVIIDNNTNVLARAEHWFGDHEDLDTFSLFNIGYGISAAHYSSGTLYAGMHGLNSEIGHSKIMPDNGLPCVCGAEGCLDAYCSIGALINQCCVATGTPLPAFDGQAEMLAEFVRQAESGRTEVQHVFQRSARYLGIIVANHINSFDPGRIILMCEHPDLPAIFSETLQSVNANCIPPMRGLTAIEFRPFDQDLFRKGAAALVLEQLYRSL